MNNDEPKDMPDYDDVASKIINEFPPLNGQSKITEFITEVMVLKLRIFEALNQAYAQGRASKIIWPSEEEVRQWHKDFVGHDMPDNQSGFKIMSWELFHWLRAKVEELNK
jgi:hypothetical protein